MNYWPTPSEGAVDPLQSLLQIPEDQEADARRAVGNFPLAEVNELAADLLSPIADGVSEEREIGSRFLWLAAMCNGCRIAPSGWSQICDGCI